MSKCKDKTKLTLASVIVTLNSLASQQASAHAYVENPKSRAFMCAAAGGNLNRECGPVAYEPQSIEYSSSVNQHYPSQYSEGDLTQCGPANGAIASGGINISTVIHHQLRGHNVLRRMLPKYP